ncbi:MAG: chromosomal replication initiator protein DnaA [Clostridia bacterium]|nr:chromosomal replication initiator protein DnaA [Clostridia bacterium]
MDSYKDIWKLVLGQLSKKYSDAAMELWFNNLNLVYLDDSIAIITTQRDGFVSLLNKKYVPDMEEILEEILSFRVKVRIYAETGFDLERAVASFDEPEESPKPQEILRKTGSGDDFYSDDKTEKTITSFDANYTFENFVVGESNKFAYKASRAVADNPTAYNPLFIYGQSGLGKTHLMKAIATEVLKRNPDYNVIIVKGESFTNELVEALAKKDTAGFKEKYRRADMLLIDDIQFIAGKVATQEEFFHTFNALYESNKQIVLTSDRPPKDMKQLEDRLRSRFESGLIIDIQPPDAELRMAILKRKAMIINLDISNEVLTFVAENVKNNIRQIEGVIKKLGAYNFVTNKPITLEVAKSQLAGVLSGKESPEVTVDRIISEISKKYHITPEEIKGKKRTKDVAMARHVAVYVIRKATDMSLQSIAKIFGRDHTTMMSSIDVVENDMEVDASFEHEVKSLIREFQT